MNRQLLLVYIAALRLSSCCKFYSIYLTNGSAKERNIKVITKDKFVFKYTDSISMAQPGTALEKQSIMKDSSELSFSFRLGKCQHALLQDGAWLDLSQSIIIDNTDTISLKNFNRRIKEKKIGVKASSRWHNEYTININ